MPDSAVSLGAGYSRSDGIANGGWPDGGRRKHSVSVCLRCLFASGFTTGKTSGHAAPFSLSNGRRRETVVPAARKGKRVASSGRSAGQSGCMRRRGERVSNLPGCDLPGTPRRVAAEPRDETRRVRLGDGEELLGWAHDEADPVVN